LGTLLIDFSRKNSLASKLLIKWSSRSGTTSLPIPLDDAILDRIVHNAHRIESKGASLRRRAGEKKKA
jgi:DNA replication protein DnaC